MWLALGPRQRIRGGEDVLRKPLVEVDLLHLQGVEVLAPSREAQRSNTPRLGSTTTSYSSAPQLRGSGSHPQSHPSPGTPLRRTASRPAHITVPSTRRSRGRSS